MNALMSGVCCTRVYRRANWGGRVDKAGAWNMVIVMTVLLRTLFVCLTALIISGCVSRGSYEELEAELNEARALLIKRDKSLKDLEGTLAALRKDLQLKEKVIEKSKSENEILSEQVQERSAVLTDQQQRYDAAQQKIEVLNEELRKQQAAAEAFAAGEAELKKRAEGLQRQADLRSDIIYQLKNQLETGRDELQVRTAVLEKQIQSLSEKLNEALLEKTAIDEVLKEEQVTNSQKMKELERLEQERTTLLTNLKQRYDTAQQKIEVLNEELRKQQTVGEAFAAGEAELKKRAEGLQRQADLRSDIIYRLRNQLESGRDELQVRTAVLEKQIQSLSEKLNETLLEKTALDEVLKVEQVTNSQKIKELERLEQERSAVLTDQLQRYDTAQQKIEVLNEELRKQQVAAETFAAGEAELKKRAEGLQISLNSSEEEMSVLKEKVAEREKRIVGMEKEILGLSNKLYDTLLKIDRLKGETTSKTSQIEMLEEELEQRSDQLADAYVSVKEMIDAEKKLQEQVEAAREALESLSSEKSEASARIEQLHKHMNERGRNLEQVQARLMHEEKMRKDIEDSMKRMERTYTELVDQFKVEMDSKEATIKSLKKKLAVTFVQDVLFRTGETAISSDGKKTLKKIGTILKRNGSDKIIVRGHSDAVVIAKENRLRFPSNWELSAARAAAVVRYFQHAAGINPRRMEVVGASFYQPAVGNDTPEDRARNRRVEIFITPNG